LRPGLSLLSPQLREFCATLARVFEHPRENGVRADLLHFARRHAARRLRIVKAGADFRSFAATLFACAIKRMFPLAKCGRGRIGAGFRSFLDRVCSH
jgi:hypothetical protein